MSGRSRVLRVAVIDDHAVVREGTEAIVARQPDMRVVTSARSLGEFHAIGASADVVLLDLNLGDEETGFRLLEEYSRLDRQQAPAVVVLSAFDYPQYVQAALDLGAAGYVLKMAPVDELVAAIRRAGDGGMSFTVRPGRAAVRLTHREEQVVAAVADGLSNEEIGVRLGISARTVASHLRRLYERLDVASRAELAARAVREGWLKPSSSRGI
jgi:DNA-binding NarL/FixJ family response regulator